MHVRRHPPTCQHKMHVKDHHALLPDHCDTCVFVIVGWDDLAKLHKCVPVLEAIICALQYVTLLFIGGISATSLRGFLRTTRKVMVSGYLLYAFSGKSMRHKAQKSKLTSVAAASQCMHGTHAPSCLRGGCRALCVWGGVVDTLSKASS